MRLVAVILAAAALAGCADTEFIAYSGAQQKWPTAQGSLVDNKLAVPVYYGLPPRPYAVLGELTSEEEARWRWNNPESEAMQEAAKAAQKRGADAVIVMDRDSSVSGYASSGQATLVGNTAFGSGFTRAMRTGHARVMAIKFL